MWRRARDQKRASSDGMTSFMGCAPAAMQHILPSHWSAGNYPWPASSAAVVARRPPDSASMIAVPLADMVIGHEASLHPIEHGVVGAAELGDGSRCSRYRKAGDRKST